MGVRVRLLGRLEAGPAKRAEVLFVALVNTGYEADAPELICPAALAARLGCWPSPGPEARWTTYETAGGEIQVCRIPRILSLQVVLPDRETRALPADLVVSPSQDESLISDALTSDLAIDPLDPRRGRWRLRDDPPGTLRESEPRELW